MAEQLYRFLRVLEYVGTRDALQEHLERRAVKGVAPSNWNGGKVKIFEGILGEGAQPLTNQMQLKLMQMIVEVCENKTRSEEYQEAVVETCSELLAFIGYKPKDADK